MWKGPERELGPKEKHNLTVQTCIWRKRRPKQMAFIWRLERDLTSRLVVLSERSLTMQRRSPEARFEMNRTKMPSPDTTKSVCKYSSKDFQIFFSNLVEFVLDGIKGIFKDPVPRRVIQEPLGRNLNCWEHILWNKRDKTTDNPGFFVVIWLYELGARAKSLQDS